MSAKGNALFKILENHPADSRVKICEDNIFQTLSSRMGTGGGERTNGYGGKDANSCKKINTNGVRKTPRISGWMDRHR